MARWLPGNKASATITARALRAAAKDLRNAAEGLDHAATFYTQGEHMKAWSYGTGALHLMDMASYALRRIKA